MQTAEVQRIPPAGVSAPRRLVRHSASAIAVVFLVLHLPFLPASLEDVDSINFALAIRHFDVAQHQPHPPGYPLFVATAKSVHLLVGDEARALGMVSVAAGAFAVPVLLLLYRRIDPREGEGWLPVAAMLLTVTAPLYWFTAARPLSDMAGLAAATAVQTLTLSATASGGIGIAAALAGIAVGVRSQIAWLTVPLLGLAIIRLPGGERRRAARIGVLALVSGCLVWAVPLILLTGGPLSYWRVLFSQGAEDLSGVRMLWTTPTPRQLLTALSHAFVAPWAIAWTAAGMLALATAGLVHMARQARGALATLAAAFGPYLLFHFLFQESITTRYALPLVPPVAYLAARGISILGWRAGVAAVVAVAVFNGHVGGTSVAAYSRAAAPAFQLLADMRDAAAGMAEGPVVAMDRREQFDLRRPTLWAGDPLGSHAIRLPSPPQHEWLELVNYWNGGGRSPAWFLADPSRTDVDMLQHGEPSRYRWPVPYPALLGGVRPNEIDWYRVDKPEWYLGTGWAVTPEIAGVSELGRTGPLHRAIDGWIQARDLDGGAVLIGGRNFEAALRPQLVVTLDDRPVAELTLGPGAFLDVVSVRFPSAATRPDYSKLSLRVTPPANVGIEQFDVFSPPNGRPVAGFGEGWNEQEYNPALGLRWRWLSERGELRTISRGGPATLHIEGESPRRYFSRPSRLTIRMGDRVIVERMLSSDFSLDVPIPSMPARSSSDTSFRIGTITLETDQFYVPAERSRRSSDRRHLGLRIFRCELRPAS
jgi:hypothetical protein